MVTLTTLLDRLTGLVDDADRRDVAELRRRIDEDRLRILVAGEAKRGKSTLINALLGRELLPTGVLPLTAVATTLTYGERDTVEITYTDGRIECGDTGHLVDLVTEERNPGNIRGIREVVVRGPYPLLQKGIELVDTPGVGSVYEHNTTDARESLSRMDVALFVTSADPPISASERAFLADIQLHAIRVLVALSKADQLDEHDVGTVRDFLARVIAEVIELPVVPYVVSARQFLRAATDEERAQSGIPALVAVLDHYLATRRRADLAASVAGHGQRLAQRAADEARLTLRTAELSDRALAERQQLFTDRLQAVERLAEESAALLDAGIHNLIATSSAAARETAQNATARLLAGFDRWVAAHDNLPTRDLDRAGRSWVADTAVAEVTDWRDKQEHLLDGELHSLTGRLQGRLAEQLDAVRSAAAEAFDLRFDGVPVAAVLSADTRFSAYGAELAGFSELLASGIRAHLPGGVGRRRIVTHLHAEVPELVDRAFGRARADLQQRLQETRRQLAADLMRYHQQTVARMQAAINSGRLLSAEHAEDRARLAAQIGDRLDRLTQLGTEFGLAAKIQV